MQTLKDIILDFFISLIVFMVELKINYKNKGEE